MDGADSWDIPENVNVPGVHAKEIEHVVLLQRRLGPARLNVGPFLGVYAALGAALAQQYITNQ